MKNLHTILIALLALAVGYLFFKPSSDTKNQTIDTNISDTLDVAPKLAFINIDSLNSQYTFIADKTEALELENMKIQGRINNKLKKMENRQAQLQKQIPTMTQAQFDAAQEELQQMQYTFQAYQNEQAQILQDIQLDFQETIKQQLDSFLIPYKEEYDFILTFAEGTELLYANNKYDITQEIINKMNTAYQATKSKDMVMEDSAEDQE